MTLLIARSFDNYREGIQGFNRVGRFKDDCQRIIFKEVQLVDKVKDLEYLKKLMQFSLLIAKNKVSFQPIVVQKLTPPVKPKSDKTKSSGANKEEEKKEAKPVAATTEGKRTPAFGQTRAN